MKLKTNSHKINYLFSWVYFSGLISVFTVLISNLSDTSKIMILIFSIGLFLFYSQLIIDLVVVKNEI
jgi:hypothetical protein